jgi:uncharacterized protein YjbJ (UPF0337 family)
MNWDQIEGKWKHVTGSAQERWGKLTDDDWKADRRQERSAGRADSERYGLAKEAEKQADEWSRAQKQASVRLNAASRR